MRTIIPFLEPARLNDVTVLEEFLEEIKKVSKKLNLPETSFRAKYELNYTEETGWFTTAEVFTDEHLTQSNNTK